MKDLSWDDLRLFLAVAEHGGLGAAARAIAVSAPTLGRRVTALEAALGHRLFVRGRSGYHLTDSGTTLLAHAQAFRAAADGVERWRAGAVARPIVLISAGHWMTAVLAWNIASIWKPDDPWILEFVTASARLDIGHRAADIGIRNRRPDEAWLAGRKLGAVAFAPYRARDFDGTSWVGITGEAAITPSAQWLHREHGDAVVIKANNPRTLLDLVHSGIGQAVLPCLIGDADPKLERSGPLIESLRSEQWLVTHHEDRHRPSIRMTADRVAGWIGGNQRLFAGETAPDERLLTAGAKMNNPHSLDE